MKWVEFGSVALGALIGHRGRWYLKNCDGSAHASGNKNVRTYFNESDMVELQTVEQSREDILYKQALRAALEVQIISLRALREATERYSPHARLQVEWKTLNLQIDALEVKLKEISE